MKNTKKTTATQTVATTAATKVETVKLGTTTYHYYRHICRPLFIENNVKTSFNKTEGYNGEIMIAKTEVAKAKKLITDLVKEQDCIAFVTF